MNLDLFWSGFSLAIALCAGAFAIFCLRMERREKLLSGEGEEDQP